MSIHFVRLLTVICLLEDQRQAILPITNAYITPPSNSSLPKISTVCPCLRSCLFAPLTIHQGANGLQIHNQFMVDSLNSNHFPNVHTLLVTHQARPPQPKESLDPKPKNCTKIHLRPRKISTPILIVLHPSNCNHNIINHHYISLLKTRHLILFKKPFFPMQAPNIKVLKFMCEWCPPPKSILLKMKP